MSKKKIDLTGDELTYIYTGLTSPKMSSYYYNDNDKYSVEFKVLNNYIFEFETEKSAKDFIDRVWVDSANVKSELVELCADQPNAVIIKAIDNSSKVKVECGNNQIQAIKLVKEVRKQDVLIRRQEQQSLENNQ